MEINVVVALFGGVIATVAMTALMAAAPMMGLPKMDMPGLLGSMFGAPGSRLMGLAMHFMMGAVFGVVYAVLFNLVVGANPLPLGALFGTVHWIVAGTMVGMMPAMHAGIKSGRVQAPGFFMMNFGGAMGFMGGLLGHVVFGIVFALAYQVLVG
ncbi:MAG: hypothetical protein IPM16_12755 [Chloroflexi bacterium]|nr:hypothetical protein [Chloroflexota bacterium]